MRADESHSRRRGWLVIGVGNEWRGDDAIGLRVALDIENQGVNGLRTVQSNGDAAALIELWKAWDLVVLVDATCSGSRPGTILRLVASDPDFSLKPGYRSSHLLGVREAMGLSRALGHIPEMLVIYGIEGASFELGTSVSPAVAAAGEEVARRILDEVSASDL